ncbi:MAG: sugar transferase [Acidaminococcaceae bacterium]
MLLKSWEDLPKSIRNDMVMPYYVRLQNRKKSLFCKFIFDRLAAFCLLVGLSPLFIILGILIKLDSDGDVFFRQTRVTQYGKRFKIYKFRTMVTNAEAMGCQITTDQDMRITKIGKRLRVCRLDELPQLINILKGEMSFVGARPEVIKYVERYSEEMMATLLLPAGVTSEASIEYKDEEKLLVKNINLDEIYVNEILPKKMKKNLEAILKFSFFNDMRTMLKTIIVVSQGC